MACFMASAAATVRDGSAPAAPVRNADLGGESEIMYGISYMTEFPDYHGQRKCRRRVMEWGHGDAHHGPAGAVLAGGEHQVPRGLHPRRVRRAGHRGRGRGAGE